MPPWTSNVRSDRCTPEHPSHVRQKFVLGRPHRLLPIGTSCPGTEGQPLQLTSPIADFVSSLKELQNEDKTKPSGNTWPRLEDLDQTQTEHSFYKCVPVPCEHGQRVLVQCSGQTQQQDNARSHGGQHDYQNNYVLKITVSDTRTGIKKYCVAPGTLSLCRLAVCVFLSLSLFWSALLTEFENTQTHLHHWTHTDRNKHRQGQQARTHTHAHP